MKRSARSREPSLSPFSLILFLAAFGPILAGIPAEAQQESPLPQGSSERESWPAVFSDRTEVNVVNVDVVVTDKKGQPVLGLTPEDFTLLADGEPVEISNFFAVQKGEVISLETVEEGEAVAGEEAPEVPAATRELSLIVFVDDSNIGAANRNRVFEKLREFLLANWRPNLRTMVVRNANGLEVVQPFTTIPHEVFASLEKLQKTNPVGPRFDLDRARILRDMDDEINVARAVPSLGVRGDASESVQEMGDEASRRAEVVLGQIRSYSQRRYVHIQRTIRILRDFVDTAAGLDGSKSVLYVSEGLPMQPAQDLYDAFDRKVQPMEVSTTMSAALESARDDSTADFLNLVAHANASKVTFNTLYAAPAASLARGSAATTGSSGGNFGFYRDSVEEAQARTSQESMILLAEETGGRYGLTSTAISGVLDGVLTDFDNHYSLGFEAKRLPSGELRRIKVRTRNPDHQVRYRSSFREKTEEEKVAARTLSALILDSEDNPLGITLKADEEKRDKKDEYIVPLRVEVPLGKLVLLPGEKAHQAQVSMYVAARDEKGRTSQVVRHLCPIRIPNSEILVALGRSAVCGVQLRMRKGEQRVAVSIRDELAAVSSTASIALDIPGGSAAGSQGAR